jgi:hypothetical protein
VQKGLSLCQAWLEIPPERLTICLHRHSRGDWGDISAEDKALNDQALVDCKRVLSAYAIDTNGSSSANRRCQSWPWFIPMPAVETTSCGPRRSP